MKIYFDNRSYEQDNTIDIYADEVYYGQLNIKGLTLVGFEVPVNVNKLHFSFHSVVEPNEEIDFFDNIGEVDDQKKSKVLV